MKPWKLAFGAAAACAACCATPIIGAMAALGSGLFAGGLAFGPYPESWWPLAAGAAALAAAAGVVAWRRQRSAEAAPGCGCPTSPANCTSRS